MSDMDAEFQKVVRPEDRIVANHASLPRAELEAHMRDAHGVVASAGALTGSVALEMVNESQLREGHRRLHEFAVEEQGR